MLELLLAAIFLDLQPISPTYIDRPETEEKSIVATCGETEFQIVIVNHLPKNRGWRSQLKGARINGVLQDADSVTELSEVVGIFKNVKAMEVLCERESKAPIIEFYGTVDRDRDTWRKIQDCQDRNGMWVEEAHTSVSFRDGEFKSSGRYIGPSCRVPNVQAITGVEQ